MSLFTITSIVAIANLIYASVIYLSLHGWLVVHEPSGMQLLAHFFITLPTTLITSILFYVLSKKSVCGGKFWKLNILGLGIPLMSAQTGVTYYHFDIVGLVICVVLLGSIAFLFGKTILLARSS